mmetsp:Transcript_3615/g.3415  ORF Transcript_3615/g.3415 Transcript_3615/m.3415 type:complete len:87 (-) Transcript_3615:3-263(-)
MKLPVGLRTPSYFHPSNVSAAFNEDDIVADEDPKFRLGAKPETEEEAAIAATKRDVAIFILYILISTFVVLFVIQFDSKNHQNYTL